MTRRKLTVLHGMAVALAACLVAGTTLDAPGSDVAFPFLKPLEPAPGGREGGALGTVAVDVDLYARMAANFSDMRVINSAGTEIPRLVRQRQRKKTEDTTHMFDAGILSFRERQDGSAEIIVEVLQDTAKRPHVITLSSRIRNFEKQVTVHGSRDRKTWTLLATDVAVFDYSRFIDLRNTAIEFSPTECRFFKLHVSRIAESHQSPLTKIVRETRGGELAAEVEKTSFDRRDFRIERVSVGEKREIVVSKTTVTREYPVVVESIAPDEEKQQTVVTFRAGGVPLDEVAIETPGVNFSRAARVQESRDEGKTWRTVGTGKVRRIRLGDYRKDAVEISLGRECRGDLYRLIVHNEDSPALDVTGVTLRGPVYDMVFLRGEDETYRVVYGGGGVAAPDYDIQDVLARSKASDAVRYVSGAEQETADYRKTGTPVSGKTVLVVCVLLMVPLLAWVVVSAAKHVEKAE